MNEAETSVTPADAANLTASDDATTVAALRETIETMKLEMDKLREDALRARAEMDNVRKRAQRDVEAAHKYGLDKFIDALLPVKDSLDLGCDAAQTATEIKSLQEGMALTQQLFNGVLDKVGVAVVNPQDDRFDPEQHQAVMAEPSETVEPGTVLRVLQKGYALNDRLIRPAMVIVAKAS